MKYIKVTNDGVLDVVGACSMLGASVKVKNGSIGMFGTGLKYALAQAARIGAKVWIASGEDVFETCTSEAKFRDTVFTKVNLKNIFSGEVHETPITTEFGNHDWVDPWNVYREIVCNAMDEDGTNLSLVNDLRRNRTKTSIYLEYDKFSEFYDNHARYFCKDKYDWIKKGSGIVYKHGVRVGKIEGLKIDMQYNYIQISESRDMSEWSAYHAVGYLMGTCKDKETWVAFLDSSSRNKVDINIDSYRNETIKAFKSALKKVEGKFAICPAIEHIQKDLRLKGIAAFVVPSNWSLPLDKLPSFKDIFKIDNKEIRIPNKVEKIMIDWGLMTCEKLGMVCTADIRVFENNDAVNGMAEAKGNNIWLHSKIFNSRERFLKTFLEEVGHHHSGHLDYTREFTDYFIDIIVNMVTEKD